MICQRCQKAQATVHIDEVEAFHGAGHPENSVEEHHLCETCAQDAQLPHTEAPKLMGELWQFLKMGAQQPGASGSGAHGAGALGSGALGAGAPSRPQLRCDTCGMGLEELRRKGRLGCEDCYSTFSEYLGQLLERMHGASEHVGRIPGVDPREAERLKEIAVVRAGLEAAVKAEDFERAAELRDRLLELEGAAGTPPPSGGA